MAIFLGHQGNVRLRRGSRVVLTTLEDSIGPDDVTLSLNRLSFDKSLDNILTGDRVDIATTDPRGLICFSPSSWSAGQSQDTISAFVNINAVGGLRFFNNFKAAVNNDRSQEYQLAAFDAPPLPITLSVRDVSYNMLGGVRSYEFSTDREAIEVTSLSDKFKQQYSAGLLSGSGRIDTIFDPETTGVNESNLLMLQLIQRIDIGSEFDLALYLTDKEIDPQEESIFYDLTAVVTRAGVSVTADDAIGCTIDFVTTGELRLIVGKPSDYILKEDDDRINLEQSLDFLLQEVED
jgi:hypothetical protein